MADTPRSVAELILDDIIARLKKITETNGYDFNIGANKVYTRAVEVARVTGPALVVIRRQAEPDYGGPGSDVTIGCLGWQMAVHVGWILADSSEDPHAKIERINENIGRALPLQPNLAKVWTSETTTASNYCYILWKRPTLSNAAESAPGKIHGQRDYVAKFETQMEDERFAPA